VLLLKFNPEPEPEKPKFNVIGVSMSKKNETPGKTENYTSEELSKLSEQVEFTYKFSVEGGENFMSLIKCTRVHEGITDQQTITPPFATNQVYTLKFSAKPNESVIGTHIFKLSYDSDIFGLDNLVDSQQSTINPEQLSRVIDNNELVSLELFVVFDDNNNELTTSIDKKRVIIKYNGMDIFDGQEIYLSPLVDTDGGVCIKQMSNGESIPVDAKFPIEISECVPLYFSKYQGKNIISTSSNPESPDAKFLSAQEIYSEKAPTNYNYKGRINTTPYFYNKLTTKVYYNDDRENALEECAKWCNRSNNFKNTTFNECKGFVIENGWDHRHITGSSLNPNAITCRPIDNNSRPTGVCNINNVENIWNGTCTPDKPRGTPDVDYKGIQNGLYWNEKKRTGSWTSDESEILGLTLSFEKLTSGPITNKQFTLEFV
jgi:hypothetical protein